MPGSNAPYTTDHSHSGSHGAGIVGAAVAGTAGGYGLSHNRRSADHSSPSRPLVSQATDHGENRGSFEPIANAAHRPRHHEPQASLPGNTGLETEYNMRDHHAANHPLHASHTDPAQAMQHHYSSGLPASTNSGAMGPINVPNQRGSGNIQMTSDTARPGSTYGGLSQVSPSPALGTASRNVSGHSVDEHHPISNTAHAQQVHHGLPPGIATATTTHPHSESYETRTQRPAGTVDPYQSTTAMTSSHHNVSHHKDRSYLHSTQADSSNTPQVATINMGNNLVPRDEHSSALNRNGLPSDVSNTAVIDSEAYAGQDRNQKRTSVTSSKKSRSRSRSHSRPRSGILPTHADANRPPTPFGLSAMGQPFEDKHTDILFSEAPTQEPLRYLYRRSRCFDTPPEVPSRSPHRESRNSGLPEASYESSISNNTTSSNSGDNYTPLSDPYKPATPNRQSVPPWEQHQYRYSGSTPPHSAGIRPPQAPWETHGLAQQRRHSPRASVDASGRRHSRSPATSINGKPRRLRFEDLQVDEANAPHERPHMPGSYDSDYNTGVGQAL